MRLGKRDTNPVTKDALDKAYNLINRHKDWNDLRSFFLYRPFVSLSVNIALIIITGYILFLWATNATYRESNNLSVILLILVTYNQIFRMVYSCCKDMTYYMFALRETPGKYGLVLLTPLVPAAFLVFLHMTNSPVVSWNALIGLDILCFIEFLHAAWIVYQLYYMNSQGHAKDLRREYTDV